MNKLIVGIYGDLTTDEKNISLTFISILEKKELIELLKTTIIYLENDKDNKMIDKLNLN